MELGARSCARAPPTFARPDATAAAGCDAPSCAFPGSLPSSRQHVRDRRDRCPPIPVPTSVCRKQSSPLRRALAWRIRHAARRVLRRPRCCCGPGTTRRHTGHTSNRRQIRRPPSAAEVIGAGTSTEVSAGDSPPVHAGRPVGPRRHHVPHAFRDVALRRLSSRRARNTYSAAPPVSVAAGRSWERAVAKLSGSREPSGQRERQRQRQRRR